MTRAGTPRGATTRTYPNGLRAIVSPDRRASETVFQLFVGVGAAHDPRNRHGLSHLLEHVVCLPVVRAGRGPAGDARAEPILLPLYAFTQLDYTQYIVRLPRRAEIPLETTLQRLAEFLRRPAIARDTVSEARRGLLAEIRSKVHGDVRGRLYEGLYRAAFGRHPYRWFTLGTPREIRAIPAIDVLSHFRRFYRPNNMVLVMTGRLDPDRAIAAAGRIWGRGPAAAPAPPRPLPGGRAPDRDRCLRRPSGANCVLVGYRLPASTPRGRGRLALVGRLLRRAFGPSGVPGWKNPFGRPKLVFGYLPATRDAAIFEVLGALRRRQNWRKFVDALTSLLDRFARAPADRGLIARLKTDVRIDTAAGWRSPQTRGEILGSREILGEGGGKYFGERETFRRLNEGDLRNGARALTRAPKTVIALSPRRRS